MTLTNSNLLAMTTPAADADAQVLSSSNAKLVEELATLLALVPAGKVVSYKQLAVWLGRERNARLIGRLMRRVQAPNWYRVLRSDGSLAFERDSSNFYQQAGLLRNEGVLMRGGRVARRHFWRPGSELESND